LFEYAILSTVEDRRADIQRVRISNWDELR